MDLVSVAGLIAATALFATGLTLVIVGLKRRVTSLPDGSEEIFAAITEGCLGGLPEIVGTSSESELDENEAKAEKPFVPVRTDQTDPIWADDGISTPIVPARARQKKSTNAA